MEQNIRNRVNSVTWYAFIIGMVVLSVARTPAFISYLFGNVGWVEVSNFLIPKNARNFASNSNRLSVQIQQQFEKAVLFYDKNNSARGALGWVSFYLNDGEKAILEWKLAGLDGRYFLKRGILARSSGNYEQARQFFEVAINLEPSVGDAWYYLGLIYYEENNWDEAKNFFEKALTFRLDEVKLSDIYLYIGTTQYFMNDPLGSADALKGLNRALSINNFSSDYLVAEAYYRRGVTRRRLGLSTEEALEDFKKSLEYNPNYRWAYIMLGDTIYEAYRDPDRAEDQINKAIEMDPNDKWPYHYLGSIYVRAGEKKKAILMYQRVLEIDPEATGVRATLQNLLDN